MAKVKVKIKKAGDPVKKVTKKVEESKEPMGVKAGETDLPEVKVTGNRPDLNKVRIHSDEYKSKMFHKMKRKFNFDDPDELSNVLQAGPQPNYHETEEDYKKKPGAIGKVNVVYG